MFISFKFKEAAEEPYVADYTWSKSRPGMFADNFFQPVIGIDVDAGISIGMLRWFLGRFNQGSPFFHL